MYIYIYTHTPFTYTSLKIPSQDQLSLSMQRVKCSHFFLLFPQSQTNSWPCIFPPNNLSPPKAEIQTHGQDISSNALRKVHQRHVWSHVFLSNLLHNHLLLVPQIFFLLSPGSSVLTGTQLSSSKHLPVS